MISLELIKEINPDDEEAIQDAYEQLAEELRGMRLGDDFTDINIRYDALNAIRGVVVEKLENMDPEELTRMMAEDEKNMFFFQDEFIRDRHPEWAKDDEEESGADQPEENVEV